MKLILLCLLRCPMSARQVFQAVDRVGETVTEDGVRDHLRKLAQVGLLVAPQASVTWAPWALTQLGESSARTVAKRTDAKTLERLHGIVEEVSGRRRVNEIWEGQPRKFGFFLGGIT